MASAEAPSAAAESPSVGAESASKSRMDRFRALHLKRVSVLRLSMVVVGILAVGISSRNSTNG